MGRWSSKCTLHFVVEYGKHPCLWDPENKDYRNKEIRNGALKALVNTMNLDNFDVASARNKIRIIRSTYWLERHKVAKSIAENADTVYRPKLSWFSAAHQVLKNSTYTANLKVKHVNMAYDEKDAAVYITPDNATRADKHLIYDIDPDPIAEHSVPENNRLKRRKEDAITNSEKSSSSTEEHEFDIFAKSVAVQLKKLPIQDALELQMEIQTLIIQRRLRVVSEEKFNQESYF